MDNITALYRDPNIDKELMKAQEKYSDCMEKIVTHGLVQPFSSMNSSSRKLLASAQWNQRIDLLRPQYPFISTGYENHFGIHSSSFVVSDKDWMVIAKIEKFSSNIGHHYFLIVMDKFNNMDVIERVSYKHTTETFGYLYDNKNIDKKQIGDYISKGEMIRRSNSFDEYNNYCEGTNIICAYVANPSTTEDAIVISKSTAKALESPEFFKLCIVINDNDIPLNLYGNDNIYKILPDIGETIKNGIVCGIRKENKDECFFTQANERLKSPMINDTTFKKEGMIIDINIWSNKTFEERKDRYYESQLNYYIDDNIRFCQEFINIMQRYIDNTDYKKSDKLTEMYINCLNIVNGKQVMKDSKIFSNIYMELTIYNPNKMEEGDKLTGRFGGKGVVSKIVSDELMPQLPDGTPVGMIWNQSTVCNRLNLGQLFESSLNWISYNIIKYLDNVDIYSKKFPQSCRVVPIDVEFYVELIYDYFSLISQEYADEWKEYLDENCQSDEEAIQYISDTVNRDGSSLYITVKPFSETMSMEKLAKIYEHFPNIGPINMKIPMVGTNGNIRYVESLKPSIAAYQYIYRMKQTSEDKHSATALSATNIRNENSKSKDAKQGTRVHSSTPIRFGEQECGIFMTMGSEIQSVNLCMYSTSTNGRRCVEQLLTGDPYTIDVKIDEDSRSRSVEKVNAILKTMGIKFSFRKIIINKINACLDNDERANIFIPLNNRPNVFISNENRPNVCIKNDERSSIFISNNQRTSVFKQIKLDQK